MIATNMWAAIANHLWQSTLFAAVALILTLALRKNQARVRYVLWLAASLKFLLPFAPLIILGQHLAELPPFDKQIGLSPVMNEIGQPFTFVVTGTGGPAQSTHLPLLLGIAWLCGFVAVLTLWALRWRRIAVAVRQAVPITCGREVDTLRDLERAGRMRRPIPLLLSQTLLEPGVFGIVRPVLLWPVSISENFSDTHLRAVLAHEVAHVRRRDNLAAALHMAVAAIFWFHPLVWWLGARLVEERERACDEEVIRLGSRPEIYAESILQTCAFCVGSPLVCVSGVTGGDLKKRIVRIMNPGLSERLSSSRKLLLVCAGFVAVVGPVFFGLFNAQRVRAQTRPVNLELHHTMLFITKKSADDDTDLSRIYRIGGEVSAPKLIFAPDPQFTEAAKKAKYQGACVIALIVDRQGKPRRVQVVRHLGMGLDQKAVEAVRQYRFEPAMLHDQAVPVEVNIEVNFRFF